MPKSLKRNDIEQIYQRLDQLASFIEKNFDELEDIGEIRSIVEDLRANLLKTIDERVEYIISKQKDIYELRFSQLEDTIKIIPQSNKEIKDYLLEELSKIKKDLLENINRIDLKIECHFKDRINWSKLIPPAIVSGIATIILLIIIALLDSYFKWNLLGLFDKIK